MRPVEKGRVPRKNGKSITFRDYRDSRPYLIKRIGEYCSYCEMQLNSSIHVEHVKPKKYNTHLKLKWSNFLLACPHCNSIKGENDIQVSDYLWPDIDDTHLAFCYLRGGKIQVDTTRAKHVEATNTLALFDLNRITQWRDSDQRLRKRKETYDLAIRYKQELSNNDTLSFRALIVDLAKSKGFWSVWTTVFKNDRDIISRLNIAFKGTSSKCFSLGTFAFKSRHV